MIQNIVVLLILVALDQITKQIAVHTLSDGSVPLIPGVFSFTLLEGGNSGAAFGMLQGGFWFFMIITVLVAALIIFVLRHLPEEKRFLPMNWTLVLLLAGAFGNCYDRVATKIMTGRSSVIDFLYFELIDFPIFNVADCYVTISAVLIIGLGLLYYKDEDFERIQERLQGVFHHGVR